MKKQVTEESGRRLFSDLYWPEVKLHWWSPWRAVGYRGELLGSRDAGYWSCVRETHAAAEAALEAYTPSPQRLWRWVEGLMVLWEILRHRKEWMDETED